MCVGYLLIYQIPRRGLASASSSKDDLVSLKKTIQSVGSIRALSKSFQFKPSIQVSFKLTFFEHRIIGLLAQIIVNHFNCGVEQQLKDLMARFLKQGEKCLS